ncbi:MAG: AAA family ATPase [Corynebacterium sp.]|nr:AAA family ATPase [Corynebacterium sp.]
MSEVSRILDAAIMHNPGKAMLYGNLLADKLETEGQLRQARLLRRTLAKMPENAIASSYALPKDSEGNLNIADIKFPDELGSEHLILHRYTEIKIAEFLNAVKQREKWVSEGIAAANRLLIYGPPGTGKTSIARLIAQELGLPLIIARSDAMMSSLLGQTSKNIRTLFEHVDGNPSVLFLDEIDALAKNRADAQEVGELQRVVIALLQNIDAMDPSTILIAATNHPDLLDPAVWRRFDHTIKVDLPHLDQRIAMWADMLEGVIDDKADLKNLGMLSAGMSGSGIRTTANDMKRVKISTGMERLPLPMAAQRLARLMWVDHYERFETDEAEIRALREWAPRIFTIRALSELFGVSVNKINNTINKNS